MTGGHANTVWARTIVDELARCGVRRVALAPGSRSTPLVLAAHEHPRIRVVTHMDERSAGFFALGSGKAGTPTAVITTSGTAAANLFPAVIEASWSGVPLLVLTADRPHRLRDADANQAIDQLRLYGPYVRSFYEVAPPTTDPPALRHLRSLAARAVASSQGADPGPVHLNFPFEKPLEPDTAGADEAESAGAFGRTGDAPYTRVAWGRPQVPGVVLDEIAARMGAAGRAIVVAGPVPDPERVGPAVRALAKARGMPLLADPLSGARFGPGHGASVISAYDLFLRDADVADALAPDLVLRFGSSPTSAALARFLEGARDAEHVVVDGGARWKDHQALATRYLAGDAAGVALALAGVDGGPAPGWRTLWERVDAAARTAAPPPDGSEPDVMATALAAVPEDGMLFVSNSMPVRDLDAFGAAGGKPVRLAANRGASGIDGIVSTALGLASGIGAPVVCVLGDLAFYHDMNGLLATREPDANVVFVVVHNDGGGIFHMLPVRAFEPAFTRHFATPHGLDFRHAAALYDLPYLETDTRDGLSAAIRDGLDAGGSRIVVVRTDRETNRQHRERAAAEAALAAHRVLSQEATE